MSKSNENNFTRLNPELKINEEKIQILDCKEFLIKSDSKQYHLKIEVNSKYMYFNVSLTDRIIDSSYQNKYDLNAIVRLLNLIPSKYTSLSQVLKFIEKAYSINKIGIIHDELNLIMTITMPMGFEEEVYRLTLYKVILSNNDIINQIVKELNSIKKVMKANGYNNDFNHNIYFKPPNTDNINKKLEELSNKMNYKDLIINELNKKMAIKDKEIRDIYNKLIDKDVILKEMNKTLKRNESQNYEKERRESINQLKIKDEEINKKLNDKAFELNNKLIDRDNALNDINKKLIEKDYLINEINNKLESQENQIKQLNEQVKEFKRTLNKIIEDNAKLSNLKDLKLSLDSNKINYNYNKDLGRKFDNYNYNIKKEELLPISPKYNPRENLNNNIIANKINNTIIDKNIENNNINKKIENQYSTFNSNNNNININKRSENRFSANIIYNNNINKIKENIFSGNNIPNNDINKNVNEINIMNKIPKKRTSIKSKNEQIYPFGDGNPNDLKFKYDLVNTNTKGGLNDIFEVFKSIKDNEDYLISPNKLNYHLDLITLKDNKFYGTLKGHQKKVTCVRYFLNQYNNNEYLISSDEMGIIFIWDISDSYRKLFTLNTKYNDIIYSCLLIFTGDNSENENNVNHNGYIVTSTYDISKENQNSATKVYSMQNGEFINYIKNTNANSVFYLLSWINQKDNRNYVIQFCYMKILISNLLDDDDVYAELAQEQKLSYYSGFIYEKKEEDKVYLYSSSKNGIINIWDLYDKILVNNININGSILCHIIQWDKKYAIVADYNGKSFKIINLETLKVEQDIGDSHTKELKTIKKVRHPLLGDSLLTAGNDNTIKLWST